MNISPDDAATVNAVVRPDVLEPVRIYPNRALGAAYDEAHAAATATRYSASDRENDDGVIWSNDVTKDPSRTISVGPHLLGSHDTGVYRDESADNGQKHPAGIVTPSSADVLLGRGGRFRGVCCCFTFDLLNLVVEGGLTGRTRRALADEYDSHNIVLSFLI